MSGRRSILITGAAGGLGSAISSRAAEAGYRVGGLDLAGAEFSGSVTIEADIEAALDAFGTPDVVVNNAGIVRFGRLLDMPLDEWRAVIDINLTGSFIVARAAARRWVAQGCGGIIVNTASINGLSAGPYSGAYAASKAGVMLMTSQMAIEWGRFGIRVNAVAPGLIDSGMSAPIYADPVARQVRSAAVPLGRLGLADDVARTVLFLASDESAYITGQTIVVDGGVSGTAIANLPRPATVDGDGTGTGTGPTR